MTVMAKSVFSAAGLGFSLEDIEGRDRGDTIFSLSPGQGASFTLAPPPSAHALSQSSLLHVHSLLQEQAARSAAALAAVAQSADLPIRHTYRPGYETPVGEAHDNLGIPTDPALTTTSTWHQWHLTNATAGIRVQQVWNDYTGSGVKVAVLDDGFAYGTTQLAPNYRTALDLDTLGNDADAINDADDLLGTRVANLIVADDNGTQTLGVAFDADLIGIRRGFNAEANNDDTLEAFQHALSSGADVMNNSWGTTTPFGDSFKVDVAGTDYSVIGAAMQDLVDLGRGGLGTTVVFSAGNDGTNGNVNYKNFQNSPYAITVAGTNGSGAIVASSTRGDAVFISAPSSSIVTNDIAGAKVSVSGTSYAAPLVSGVAALMYDANADLGWRDVHEILALTARQTTPADASWVWNDGTGWNGGGMHFSNRFGFGLVDARAAVRLAETWDKQQTSANMERIDLDSATPVAIPTRGTITSTLSVAQDIRIERVLVDLDIAHARAGDLIVTLTAPDGTVSTLVNRIGGGTFVSQYGITGILFEMSSNAFRGETSAGTWTLKVDDVRASNGGTLNAWGLSFLGSAIPAADDLYVYTDDFAGMTGPRTTLTDSNGGTDTLNLSAVSTAVTVNLTSGATSTVAGNTLTLAAGTSIETLYTGDGNDVVTGSTGNELIETWRGDDTVSGGSGHDVVRGGAGTDNLSGDAGNDLLYGGVGDDTLSGGADLDTLYGEDGNDILDGGDGGDALYGGAGNDTLTGGAGLDTLEGQDGTDTLDGGNGDDLLLGGAGNDTIEGGAGYDALDGGDGDDTLYGGLGTDTIEGGTGTDTLVLAHDAGDYNFTFVDANTVHIRHLDIADGIDIVTGMENFSFAGTVYDRAGLESYWTARGGNLAVSEVTLLWSGGLYKTLSDRNGTRVVTAETAGYGGSSGDQISVVRSLNTMTVTVLDPAAPTQLSVRGTNLGDSHNFAGTHATMEVFVRTGQADDTIVFAATLSGNHDVYGEDGNDTVTTAGGADLLNGGAGNDVLNGLGGNDNLVGDLGDDTLNGGDGNDTLSGGDGVDLIEGGAGDDTAQGGAGQDTVNGGDGNDSLYGNDGNDVIAGGAGADRLYGLNDDDTLDGGADNDLIYGGNGVDTLDGGNGNDTLYGDAGNDTLRGGDGDDALYGYADADTLYGDAGADRGFGGLGNDVLYGGSGNDTLRGEDGDDTLHGEADADQLFGGAGTDTLAGGDGADLLYGDDGSDTLRGEGGSDTLRGGLGNDLLIGGDGADTLYGDGGSDVYALTVLDAMAEKFYLFTLSGAERDFINVTDILTGFTPGVSDIDEFVKLVYVNTSRTDIQIDADGGGNSFTTAVQVFGNWSGLTAQGLYDAGTLIADQSVL